MTAKSDVVETRTARIYMREDGIACICVAGGPEQTRADVENSMSHVARLSKGTPCPLLMDIRESNGIDREGRHYSASDGVGRHITGMAILIKSSFSRVMGNFWLRTTNPLFPTQLFTSEQKAVDWLKQHDEAK